MCMTDIIAALCSAVKFSEKCLENIHPSASFSHVDLKRFGVGRQLCM